MRLFIKLLLITGVLLLYSCAAKQPYYKMEYDIQEGSIAKDRIDYELFLVGDIGGNSKGITDSHIVDLIKSQLSDEAKNQSVVFLGNSFSSKELPEEDTEAYKRLDVIVDECISKLKSNTDNVFFIPGNKEWYDGHKYSLSEVQLVEEYVEAKVGGENIYVPSNGCGEPKVVTLTDDLLLLLIDSQWVLQGDASGQRSRAGCEIDTELELVTYIQEALSKNKNKNVIIAAHHPVVSNGISGGNYSAASHLFPIPIIGSIITGIKKINGGKQKFGHPQYEAYRAAMDAALDDYKGVIHVSAHDKNLQYHLHRDNHFVIAGSGTKTDYVRRGGEIDFALMKTGFAKITHTRDLELWLEFFVPEESNPKIAKSIFKKLLYKKEIIDYSDKTVYKDLDDYPESVKASASKQYLDSKFGFGENYRDVWNVDIDLDVLLLDEIEGGLKPIRQGGGLQTTSLRLENPEGRQWVLRSVDKSVNKLVPHQLRKTFIKEYVQDDISATHPYGALVVPKLAKAAKVYHANPKYVYLPKQKALGDYNSLFGENVYLFEERPGGNMEGHPNYGDAVESVSSQELVSKLYKNHKHKVDQEYVLRATLLDLLVGDWDRHDDQWRWGIYNDESDKDVKLYSAIPRDRDQVFYKNDGFVNYIVSRPYIFPSIRKFGHDIDFVRGLIFTGRHFDRHFLSELNEESYIRIAQELQAEITDQVVKEAVRTWPTEVHTLHGEAIEEKIIARRNALLKYGREFYRDLTREVTVIGTNNKNFFEVLALEDDRLEVKVFHSDKKGRHQIWSRVIEGKDCKELRLFGLKKADTFNFYGQEKSSIKVRIIGGSGKDVVNNESKNIKILAYDRPTGMTLNGNKVKSKLKNQDGVNKFDRLDWKLDRNIHFPIFSFYTDEGIGLTYNFLWRKNGFRRNPYKSDHSLNFGYFVANSAVISKYSGNWKSIFDSNWDFRLDAKFTGPIFTQFFYGLGNEYINFEDLFSDNPDSGSSSFYVVRGANLYLNPHFIKGLGNNRTISLNSTLEYLNFENKPSDPVNPLFVFTNAAGRDSTDFQSKLYLRVGLEYVSNRVNSKKFPTRGYEFTASTEFRQSLLNSDKNNLTFASNLSAYVPFSPTHKVVLAMNLGGAYTFGDYEFFHANYLSNRSRLRGFRTNRFAGDAIVYHATDVRVKLLQGRGKVWTGLGVFGSFDYGRAFLEGENINDWHTSYGGGIYITPLDALGFKIGYYVGDDDTQFSIGGSLSF